MLEISTIRCVSELLMVRIALLLQFINSVNLGVVLEVHGWFVRPYVAIEIRLFLVTRFWMCHTG